MKHAPSRQIVVGVDGSAASNAAVRWAVREARLRHAAVRLVCAHDSDARLNAPYAQRCWVGPDEQSSARARLDRGAELARPRLPAGRLIAELVNEPPAWALLDRSTGAEMLVLDTNRPTVQPGQPPLALGPVARSCLRRAHCPSSYRPGRPGTRARRPARQTGYPAAAKDVGHDRRATFGATSSGVRAAFVGMWLSCWSARLHWLLNTPTCRREAWSVRSSSFGPDTSRRRAAAGQRQRRRCEGDLRPRHPDRLRRPQGREEGRGQEDRGQVG